MEELRRSRDRPIRRAHDLTGIVAANQRAVDRIVARGEGAELRAILRRAEADLRQRMHQAYGRGLDSAWTGVQLDATRVLVLRAVRDAERAMEASVGRGSAVLLERGMLDTLEILAAQERRFAGLVKPLALERALRFEYVLHGAASSRLRQYASSVHRYGTRMIQEFEGAMQTGIINRLTVGQMTDLVAGAMRRDGLLSERHYLAARIVRTELLASYNLGAQTVMEEEREDFPDLQRMILAHHDRRTAADSIFVHGEIRGLDEDFVDGAGRVYRVPPARPNDREIVIPWRRAWAVPRAFMRRG